LHGVWASREEWARFLLCLSWAGLLPCDPNESFVLFEEPRRKKGGFEMSNARLHYHRWTNDFILDTFSSEDSMRDYLFSNPTLFFLKNDWVIPIKEENWFPISSRSDREYGRADIILCRILKIEKVQIKETKKIDLSNIELWVVELKKEEASYENGFMQLLDYITVINNENDIKNKIKEIIKSKMKDDLGINNLEVDESSEPFTVHGSLIAPSFDLIGRTKKSLTENVIRYEDDYKKLERDLTETHKSNLGFTLADLADATDIALIKLIRFKRSDEIIIYAEHILGEKAERKAIQRINPISLFEDGTLREDDIFYFKDSKEGKEYRGVKCKVAKKKGRSDSFMIRISTVEGYNDISITKGYRKEFNVQPFPAEGTVKMCSIALHKLFNIYSEDQIWNYYSDFGDNNFVRESDGKTLLEIREEQRNL